MPPPNPLSHIFQHIRNDQLDAALQLLKSGKLTNRQKRLVNEYAQQLESLSKRLQRLTLSPDEYLKDHVE